MKIETEHTESLNRLKPTSIKTNKKTQNTNQNSPSAVLNLSNTARQIHKEIKHIDALEQVREDIVAEAKTELKNWNKLSDEQINQVFNNIFEEMSLS